jgi:hypothetical protein
VKVTGSWTGLEEVQRALITFEENFEVRRSTIADSPVQPPAHCSASPAAIAGFEVSETAMRV